MGTNPNAGEEQQSTPEEEPMDDAGWTHVKGRDVLEQDEPQDEAIEDDSDNVLTPGRDNDEDLDDEEDDEDLACVDGARSDYDDDDDDDLSDEEDMIAEKAPEEEEVASDDEDWDMVDMAEN